MSAVRALIAMSAQRGSAAARDGQQHFFVLPVDPPATAFNKGRSCMANDIGHLQRRPVHSCFARPPCSRMVSASRGLAVTLRCLLDKCR